MPGWFAYATTSQFWSRKFDREVTDNVAIQDEIARGIVNSLRLKLGRGRRRYETSAEAYDLYLRARALEFQRTGVGLLQGIGLLEQAVAEDPAFAPAQAGLAWAYALRSGRDEAENRPDDLPTMRAAMEKVLELDPLLPEAYAALGVAYAREGQWDPAEKSFRRALEIDPNNSTTYGLYAMHLLLPLGRVE
jgi:adenylate cyclase